MTTMLTEIAIRRQKADALREAGIDPFPDFSLEPRALAAEVNHSLTSSQSGGRRQLAGRIVARKVRGPITYLTLRDRSGSVRLRICRPEKNHMRPTAGDYDIGDIVAVSGIPLPLQSGEIGIDVTQGTLLAKSLHGNHGLGNPAHIPRPPELRLMSSSDAREHLLVRSHILTATREWMRVNGFVEVESPILQRNPSGAAAQPFVTRHNATGRNATLRLSSQLSLRRYGVGDFERVYEIGRCFRNEGRSPTHSQEFTMLEWTLSYSNYRDSAELLERLLRHIARHPSLSEPCSHSAALQLLALPWRHVSLRDLLYEQTQIDILGSLQELFDSVPVTRGTPHDWALAVDRLYTTEVEPRLERPTVVYDFPREIHPCARTHPADERLAQCFDLVIGGLELASGGTEISDPDEQTRRFLLQRDITPSGDLLPSETDYVLALTYGAPPSSGVGLGIDRLMMCTLAARRLDDVRPFGPMG
jgi:lysyl-tRNA synthetase, class II